MRGGRGRGRGRGRPDDVAATASGPFSLGPAAQGTFTLVDLYEISDDILTIALCTLTPISIAQLL